MKQATIKFRIGDLIGEFDKPFLLSVAIRYVKLLNEVSITAVYWYEEITIQPLLK